MTRAFYNEIRWRAEAVCQFGIADWAARRMRATAEDRAVSLLRELIDPCPCLYDHNGLCQAHSLHQDPCPHETAKLHLQSIEEAALGVFTLLIDVPYAFFHLALYGRWPDWSDPSS